MGSAPALRGNIDHARHANRAAGSTKVRKGARLRKSVLVNRAGIGQAFTPGKLVSSCEQNYPSIVHGSPLLTLWPVLAHVDVTASPT
jgi:hypothetical protein